MKYYQPGRMGVTDSIGLIFMFTFSVVFLTLPSQEIELAAGAAWLTVLTHSVAALVMVLVMLYVCSHVQGDLYSVCEALLGKWGARGVLVYFAVAFFGDFTLITRHFAEHTLLTSLPEAEFSFVVIAYVVTVALMTHIGLEGIARASYLLLPFAVIAVFVVLTALIPYYYVSSLAPYQGTGIGVAIANGMALGGVNFGIMILPLLAPSFQRVSAMVTSACFGMSISAILHAITVTVCIMVFGVGAGQERVLPFFSMARAIYLNRYIQHMEAFFIVLWVLVGTITMAIDMYCGLYCLTRMGNLPSLRPFIPLAAVALLQLAMIPPDIHTVIELFGKIGYYYNIGVYGLPPLLLAVLVIRRKGKVKRPWAPVK